MTNHPFHLYYSVRNCKILIRNSRYYNNISIEAITDDTKKSPTEPTKAKILVGKKKFLVFIELFLAGITFIKYSFRILGEMS